MGFLWFNHESVSRDEITYSFFREQLAHNNIAEVEFIDRDQLVGKFKEPPTDVADPTGRRKAAEASRRKEAQARLFRGLAARWSEKNWIRNC